MASRAERLKAAQKRLKDQQSKVIPALKVKLKKAREVMSKANSGLHKTENAYWQAKAKTKTLAELVRSIQTEPARRKKREAEARKNKARFAQKWYKWIRPKGMPPIQGGSFRYDMPKDGKPGKWHQTSRAETCYAGFHATQPTNGGVKNWARGGANLYEVKVGGSASYSSDKGAFTKMQVLREIKKDSVEYNKLLGITRS